MKIRFYVDLYPGADPQKYSLCAWTSPIAKPDGVKRIAFDVAIPDSLLFGIDMVSPEVSKIDIVEEHAEKETP